MKTLYLRWSYFDEEAAAFVWNLEDFGPGETVDPQFVFVNHQTTGANPQHDVNTIQILTETPRETNRKIFNEPSTGYADFRELSPSEGTWTTKIEKDLKLVTNEWECNKMCSTTGRNSLWKPVGGISTIGPYNVWSCSVKDNKKQQLYHIFYPDQHILATAHLGFG